MTDIASVIDGYQGELLSVGVHESYRNAQYSFARMLGSLPIESYQEAAEATRASVRAELPFVPIIQHGDCDKCLHIGKLAADESRVFDFSSTVVAVNRNSDKASVLATDLFNVEQLRVIKRQADELEEMGVGFYTPYS